MKEKNIQALRSVLEDVKAHEAETDFSAVSVDLADLKRVLHWAQNNAHVWFKGDRVILTGASVPFDYLDNAYAQGVQGTIVEESHEDGRARVQWDNQPLDAIPVWMFHNEIKKVRS